VIVDLEKAPRNARGMVEYVSDFLILKPVDMSKSNGKIFYGINNRGNTGALGSLNDAVTGRERSHHRRGRRKRVLDAEGVRPSWTPAGRGDVLPGNFRLTAQYPTVTGPTITGTIAVQVRPSSRHIPRERHRDAPVEPSDVRFLRGPSRSTPPRLCSHRGT